MQKELVKNREKRIEKQEKSSQLFILHSFFSLLLLIIFKIFLCKSFLFDLALGWKGLKRVGLGPRKTKKRLRHRLLGRFIQSVV